MAEMTDFRQRVYRIVSKIPRGTVATYGQIAMLLGDYRCSRAVGNALHQNTDPIQTPCHRVVNGEGYLAMKFGMGGSAIQRERLEAEGVVVVHDENVKMGHPVDRVDLSKYAWDGRVGYHSLNGYLKETFGGKVYKLALDGGFTCPNRDGTIGTDGCIFCSAGGSGDFAQSRNLSITEQIEQGKSLVDAKFAEGEKRQYIAYLQAFTNTYAPIERLRAVYEEALSHPEVVVLSIATRPDCIDSQVVGLLLELREKYKKPIWVELGLQTIHEKSAEYIRRGYPRMTYELAMEALSAPGVEIPVITHVILGLPGETKKQMLETVAYVGRSGSAGIKLQLLHVLEGTDLAKDYEQGKFQTLQMDEYCALVRECIAILPKDMVIHRMTGDGDKKILIAPEWSANKRAVLNLLQHYVVADRV